MKRTSPTAALAVALLFASLSVAAAADDMPCHDAPLEAAHAAEERMPGGHDDASLLASFQPLAAEIASISAAEGERRSDFPFDGIRAAEDVVLGADDEEARFAALQPFTRDSAATGVVVETLAGSLAEAGLPQTVALELRQALAGAIDVEREIGAGDRFYVRYRQPFTAEGVRIGTPQLLWAELRTTVRGTLALHRFRPQGGTERLWSTNGEALGGLPMRLPLDIINVSSGFGMRPDPLDKPGPAMGPLAEPAPVVATPAPEPPPPAPKTRQPPLPPPSSWLMMGNGSAFGTGPGLGGLRDPFEGRPHVRRRAEPTPPPEAAPPPEPLAVAPPPPPPATPRLFMHDGLDLVAVTGTSIYAAADGIVTGAGPNGGYGNWMQIDHAGKVTTVYGHLSAFAPGIEAGTRVSQGEFIGFVGNTGRSTGAHLHFEIVANGRTVNPLAFPAIKRAQLAGADLERFKKQVKRSLEERDREVKVNAEIAGMPN